MDEKERVNQIFHDPKKIRWRFSKKTGVLVMLALFVMGGVLVASLFATPILPQLSLNQDQVFEGDISEPAEITVPLARVGAAKSNQDSTEREGVALASSGRSEKQTIAFFVNWDDKSLVSLQKNIDRIDQLIPEWLHLQESDGSIIRNNEEYEKKVLKFIQQSGEDVKITPLINNFNPQTKSWESEKLEKLLADSSSRAKLIQNLLSIAKENGFAGVHIDFENISQASRENLVTFEKELGKVFRQNDLEVSQSVPLLDPAFDLEKLAQENEFLVFMAYDEHTAFATESGPISSQKWFEDSISKALQNIDRQKMVIGLGNYGYEWVEGELSGRQLSFLETMRLAAKKNVEVALDETHKNYSFSYQDNQNRKRTVWFLDAVAAYNQISFASKFEPQGFALWRLGAEDPDIWNLLENSKELGIDHVRQLSKFDLGYEVIYEGHGEIKRVTERAREGVRTISFDKEKDRITASRIKRFPSPVVISRWGDERKKQVALTFDDGPDSKFTPQILKVLEKHQAKATFFIVGTNASKNPSLIKKIFNEGHEIGSHTFTHPNITKISERQMGFELNGVQRVLESEIGRRTTIFRPPFAKGLNPSSKDEAKSLIEIGNLGYYTVGINVDPRDWYTSDADVIASTVVNNVLNNQGNVILLHDGGGDRSATIEALPKIISSLQANGYLFVSVSELLNVPKDEVMPPLEKGKINAMVNFATLKFTDWFTSFLKFMFIAGIFLGVSRTIFVAVLSFVQIRKRNKRNAKGYDADYQPFVSVIVPAFNEEKVISKTIRSLFESTYQNFEIVVVDDGSSDDTVNVVDNEFFKDYPKVRVLEKGENGGKASAINYGMKSTRAEIIFVLDADTIFLPDTIEKMVRHFENPKIGAVAGNAKVGNRINLLTRTQAIEYVSNQNLDRRAFEVMNSISVVPGAIGAWRRKAVMEAGGYSSATLAEDADLTFAVLREGYKIIYEDEAIALTEAPDRLKTFIKQRFRWMYGMLQVAWKHRKIFMRPSAGGLGLFSSPNIVVFQVIFPLISPIADFLILSSIGWAIFQKIHFPSETIVMGNLHVMLNYYVLFLVFELGLAAVALMFEPKEDKKLLVWVVLQRFFYRQIMYFVAIKTVLSALKGALVGWNKFERKATVDIQKDISLPQGRAAVTGGH